MLFHSPHSSHCPCQRKDTDPHCWQTYFFFTFAIAPALSEHMRNTRENLETERTSVALFASARCCRWTLLGVLAFYPGRPPPCPPHHARHPQPPPPPPPSPAPSSPTPPPRSHRHRPRRHRPARRPPPPSPPHPPH